MCKTIKQKIRFQASPEQIYKVLTDSREQSIITGQTAKISKKIGGAFSTRNGHVTGINVDLAPGERVVQAWRSKAFPHGIFSMASFQLSRLQSGGTEVVLTHRGVPKDLIPQVESDWRRYYWDKIRRCLTS